MSSINQFKLKQYTRPVFPNGYQVRGLSAVQSQAVGQAIPPYTNRGGIPLTPVFSTPLPLPPPTPKPSAIVDYLTFTFSLDGLQSMRRLHGLGADILPRAEAEARESFFLYSYLCLADIFTVQDEVLAFMGYLSGFISDFHYIEHDRGLFGYRKSIGLYRDGQPAGKCAYDGNNNTCMVSLTGFGCSGVDMMPILRILESLPGCKITRVDLAHDDLNGSISLEKWQHYYDLGLFHIKGATPTLRMITNSDTGKGDTIYVGNKANGKEACIYEKGKQLGDRVSVHVRVEGRLTSVDRIIPFDVITNPAVYLAAMYPAFGYLSAVHERIDVIKKQAKLALELSVSYAKNNCGKLVNVLLELGRSSDEIVNALQRPGVPKRLIMPFAPCPF